MSLPCDVTLAICSHVKNLLRFMSIPNGVYRIVNVRYEHLVVLTDEHDGSPLTMRIPNLHEDETRGDKVGYHSDNVRSILKRNSGDYDISQTIYLNFRMLIMELTRTGTHAPN